MTDRWRLVGGPLGRVYVDAGPSLPEGIGVTVDVVRAEERDRYRDVLLAIAGCDLIARDENGDRWIDTGMPMRMAKEALERLQGDE